MSEDTSVGFRQRIRLEWLDLTAQLYLAGNTKEAIRDALETYLQEYLSIGSTAKSGNRALTTSILMRMWVTPLQQTSALRDEGVQLFQRLPPSETLVLHWGLAMATYSFFETVAETVGRLLRLQGTIAAAQIQRRMRERYGERSTIARATRRALRSMIDWGVLQDTEEKGIYQAGPTQRIDDREEIAWLVEALLIGRRTTSGALRTLAQHPALFPFELVQLNPRTLANRSRLELFRQGIDEDIVLLHPSTQ